MKILPGKNKATPYSNFANPSGLKSKLAQDASTRPGARPNSSMFKHRDDDEETDEEDKKKLAIRRRLQGMKGKK